MYCKTCGQQINDEAVICPHCGCSTNNEKQKEAKANIGWGLLGLFIPMAGLILYLLWKNEKPEIAKMAGKGALISVIISVVISIIYLIIFISTVVAFI